MEIGNLVKKTLPFASYINPPFAFLAPKEKHKYIGASAQTRLTSHTNRKKKILNKKIMRLCGREKK